MNIFHVACICAKPGSNGETCNDDGQCSCKDHFIGLKCDALEPDYYDINDPKRK